MILDNTDGIEIWNTIPKNQNGVNYRAQKLLSLIHKSFRVPISAFKLEKENIWFSLVR